MPADDLSSSDLDALVEAADPKQMLPGRYEGEAVTGHLSLVDAYQLGDSAWLAVVRATSGELFAAPCVVAAEGSLGFRGVRRAEPGDGVAHALLALLAEHVEPHGHPSSAGPSGFAVTALQPGPRVPGAREWPLLVDQTHESVVVAEQVVVKWAVRAEPTPAPTVVAHLVEAGLTEMAKPWGFVTWNDGGQPVLLASVAQFLEGATDGWSWAVGDAGDFATGKTSLDRAASSLARVGELTADLHVAMATATSVISRPRSQAAPTDVARWTTLARGLLQQAVDEVDGDEGERLREAQPRVESVLATLSAVRTTPTIPVHGDLHVGQILRWSGGYAVGDFDGNPVLPVAARMEPQPAARDVAGMLQSLDHVGRVVNARTARADPLRTCEWISAAQTAFLDAYMSRLASRGLTELLDQRLVLPFQVEQECREFLYAVRHLPRWRYVPDQALQALLAAVD